MAKSRSDLESGQKINEIATNAVDASPGSEGEDVSVGILGGSQTLLTGAGEVSSGFDDGNIVGTLGNEAAEKRASGDMSPGIGWGPPDSPEETATMKFGQPTGIGALDEPIVRRYMKRNWSSFGTAI